MSEHDIAGGALFQIAEPDAPQTQKRRAGLGIGIDLGTTHSLVGIAPHGADPRVLVDAGGDAIVPSVVSYARGEDEVVVGRQALDDRTEAPTRVIASVKRFMGRGGDDVGFSHPYTLDTSTAGLVRFDVGRERRPTPMEVSSEILCALKQRAEAELGGTVDGAVITVPAYFDEAQRQATKDAGRLAGLEVYRLLAEPTAAALAYGLDKSSEGLFAVYDLGGGTFDISVLRLREGVFQVLATGGDSALGGDDFDRVLADRLLAAAGVSEPTPGMVQAVQAEARAAKERLTEDERTTVAVPALGLEGHELSRADFEALIEPLVKQTVRACRQTLKDAELRARELDGVVLVGGSTRVPAVRREVEAFFGRAPLADIDPDRVVALGAAIQADILSGNEREGVTLLDVVPLSLGLETMGGIVEKIIPRNATIPIAARQVFTNYSEQQTGMSVHVVQGERELAADCRSLARFELEGIPQLPPSMARVEITFQLDADALLTVTAKELMTGIKQTVQVKPTYGLAPEEIEQIVDDSMDYARADFDARNAAEARVELGRVVLAVRKALTERGDEEALLPASEREGIEQALKNADAAMADERLDGAGLNETREHLERVSEAFARRRMEQALASGMAGQTVDSIEKTIDDEADLDARRGAHGAERLED